MITAKTTVEIEKKFYAAQLATITGTALGYGDRSILTASITCTWPGGGISPTGGYVLDDPVKDADGTFLGREPIAAGLEYITRIMEVVGVSQWEDLIGKRVWVLFPEGKSSLGMEADGIAAVDSDECLVFKEFWEAALS